MKREIAGKSKLWLWLVIGAIVLAGAVVLGIFLFGGEKELPAESPVNGKLYWNVDRKVYTENAEIAGFSDRVPGTDGLYHVRFFADGGIQEFLVVDKQLVNYIDSMDVMGLVFDETGVVTDAVDPETIATRIADTFYVQNVSGKLLALNSSMVLNGMEKLVKIEDTTEIYDVNPNAETLGAAAQIGVYDVVTVYGTSEGKVTHIFITERAPKAEVYWRANRKFNAETGVTNRKPDENGVYTIPFAKGGQQVELKCKDISIVNQIDQKGTLYGAFALKFDEEGYIVETVAVAMALQGKTLCEGFHVTEVDGNLVTAKMAFEGSSQGQTITFSIDENCDIFMCCAGCYQEHVGERITQLQVGDCVVVYTDMDDKPIRIYVPLRKTQGPMYYNLNRSFDDAKNATTRKPDKNGYYVFEMLEDGKQLTLKTKSKELADAVDRASDSCLGLEREENIITAVFSAQCVAGYYSPAYNSYVTTNTGTIISVSSGTNFETVTNCVISADCKIYDVTGYPGVKKGTQTQVQMYDQITAWFDEKSELVYIYVTARYVEGLKHYYNLAPMYDAAAASTTRQKDQDGYYVYEMICDGKKVTVKTKDKKLADYIDMQDSTVMGLKVSGGIIKAAYPAVAAEKYLSKYLSYMRVDSVDKDGTVTFYWVEDGKVNMMTAPKKLAANCKIYNVSQVYNKAQGELTTLKRDDYIQGFVSNDIGEITKIFIIRRSTNGPLYWSVKRRFDENTQQTTRTPDADGYYTVDLAVDGSVKTFRTKDKAIMSAVDAKPAGFALQVDGDIIKGVAPYYSAKNVATTPIDNMDVAKLSGNKVTVKENRSWLDNAGEEKEIILAKNCKFYDVSFYSENFGAEIKLEVGDRVKCYANKEGQIIYCYIVRKNTRQAGYMSKCDHCNEVVRWEPYDGYVYARDAHYYLPADYLLDQGVVGSDAEGAPKYDVVFDLNGKILKGGQRNFLVYGTLSVMDSVGSGRMETVGTGNGGNVNVINGTLNIYGGTLTAGAGESSRSRGGVVIATNSVVNMYGGGLEGGSALEHGGNLYLKENSVFNMYGGTITEGSAKQGGNIYAITGSVVNITGGTVSKGTATDCGGNFYLEDAKAVVGCTVTGGKADGENGGGNVYLTGGATLEITGSVKDPAPALGGANIRAAGNAHVILNGGTISGGEALSFNGGNLRMTGSAKLTIQSGTISGGSAPNYGAIYIAGASAATPAEFTMLGGKIEGTVGTLSNTKVTLSGAPVITDLILADGAKLGLENLVDGTDITIVANGVFASPGEKAQQYAAYFKTVRLHDKVVAENGDLVFVSGSADKNNIDNAPLEFDQGTAVAVCPLCGEKVQWTALSGDQAHTLQSGHYYLSEVVTYTGTVAPFMKLVEGNVCLHLNGKDLTATGHRVLGIAGGQINIMGTGKVTGSLNDRGWGAAINIAGGTLNLLGGTYTRASGTTQAGVLSLRGGSSVVNMYNGASIVGVEDNGTRPNVIVFHPGFNMYGGTISGGAVDQIAVYNYDVGVTGSVQLLGGTVTGNISINGDASKRGVFVVRDATVIGNVTLAAHTETTISGGKINGTVTVVAGATNTNTVVTLQGEPVIDKFVLPQNFELTIG